MSRIAETFARLSAGGGRGFIPFITAGDPDLETSFAILEKLPGIGADIMMRRSSAGFSSDHFRACS